MSFPGDSLMENYGSVRGRDDQNLTVRQAYEEGAASVVKALSEYLDSLLNKAISTHLEAAMPLDTPHLARYPDLFAFSVIMAFSGECCVAMKKLR
ncbi:unnamed protein product [Chrysodeixis includens]|uniref:Uncharacterized protein n=1 Tax=Chrysodeixis includens TaxID=689277 RepID=A0A9N8KTK6_CHRIL|nr:unnamed protein product [Chrysodeixis includens]